MITILTIPKSFDDPHINIIQTNAIKSWLELGSDCNLVLIGNDSGVAEKARELNIKHLPNVKCNEFNTPLLDSAFELARNAFVNEYLVFINADIILFDDFLNVFKFLSGNEEFLVAGQRWDIDIRNKIDFQPSWQKLLKKEIEKNGRSHPVSGSDYFIFKKDSFKNIPSFAVGRVSWDTWMIQEAVKRKMLTIDASDIVTVIHQNHDYKHQVNKGIDKFMSKEGKKNILLTNARNGFCTTKDLKWELDGGNLQLKEYFKFKNRIKRFVNRVFLKKTTRKIRIFYKKYSLKQKIKKMFKEGRELKIIIGASKITQEGWISTEEDFLNIVKENDWDFLFNKDSITTLLAEHVWEHLSKKDGEMALKNCFQYLKPGGYLRIAVPDGFSPDQGYIDNVKPGGNGAGAKSHKILFNYKSLSESLELCGFKVDLLEFFNEKGEFVQKAWKKSDGLVRRSRDFDKRNTSKKLNYSSLIIDAKK